MSDTDPYEKGREDMAVGRGMVDWSADEEATAEAWPEDGLTRYFEGMLDERQRRAPARAPAPWPAQLSFLAGDALLAAALRRRELAYLPLAMSWFTVKTQLGGMYERRRALQLGLQSAADEPEVPFLWPIGASDTRPGVLIAAGTSRAPEGCLWNVALALLTSPARALWGRRRGRDSSAPGRPWEVHLAQQLSFEILRRRSWRLAANRPIARS